LQQGRPNYSTRVSNLFLTIQVMLNGWFHGDQVPVMVQSDLPGNYLLYSRIFRFTITVI
jgi:hypothetical protein